MGDAGKAAVASAFVRERLRAGADARDIMSDMVERFGARVTYPSYRTALRLAGIYTEATTSCGLATAKLIISSWLAKAEVLAPRVHADDLFSAIPASPVHHRSAGE